MADKHMEQSIFNIFIHKGSANQNNTKLLFHSDWQPLRKHKITNAGKNVWG
jgi:hypothetical protein